MFGQRPTNQLLEIVALVLAAIGILATVGTDEGRRIVCRNITLLCEPPILTLFAYKYPAGTDGIMTSPHG